MLLPSRLPHHAYTSAGLLLRPVYVKNEHATAAHAGLEIFVDDEFQTGGQGTAREGLSGGAGVSLGAPVWAQLGSFEQTRKENVQQAGAWAGAPWHVLLPFDVAVQIEKNGKLCT